MNDCLLEVLGDYFVKHDLANKGWEFHEFVAEWQLGTIVMDKIKSLYRWNGYRPTYKSFQKSLYQIGRLFPSMTRKPLEKQ